MQNIKNRNVQGSLQSYGKGPLKKDKVPYVWFQALLKKHEALMSDLSAYGSSIQALREQAQSCRVSIAAVLEY